MLNCWYRQNIYTQFGVVIFILWNSYACWSFHLFFFPCRLNVIEKTVKLVFFCSMKNFLTNFTIDQHHQHDCRHDWKVWQSHCDHLLSCETDEKLKSSRDLSPLEHRKHSIQSFEWNFIIRRRRKFTQISTNFSMKNWQCIAWRNMGEIIEKTHANELQFVQKFSDWKLVLCKWKNSSWKSRIHEKYHKRVVDNFFPCSKLYQEICLNFLQFLSSWGFGTMMHKFEGEVFRLSLLSLMNEKGEKKTILMNWNYTNFH